MSHRPKPEFDKYTDRARNVLTLAGTEAKRLGHHYIGTEHILLGILREGEGLGATCLQRMGIELDAARQSIEAIIRGDK